jgi:ATP-dependent DNA ligase
LPPDLAGPVEVELAKLTEHIPAPASMPGGARYEPKFDGYLH